MAADNSPKYLVEIVGWDGAKVRSFSGEPSIRKLEYDSRFFQITEVVGPGPPKLVVTLLPSYVSDIAALKARVTVLENVIAAATTNPTPGTLALRDESGILEAAAFKGQSMVGTDGLLNLVSANGSLALRILDDGLSDSELRISSGKFATYNQTPVARQVVAIGASTNDVITAIQNVGLVSEA